jgi:hypothetical protein
MFSYNIVPSPLLVQILHEDNVIDESGPWESMESAVNWASAYVNKLNSGVSEPQLDQEL